MYLFIIFVWYIGCLLVFLRARGRVYPSSGCLGLGLVVLGSIAGLIIFPNYVYTLLAIIGYNLSGKPFTIDFSELSVQTVFGIIVGWLVSAVVLGLWFFSDRPVFGESEPLEEEEAIGTDMDDEPLEQTAAVRNQLCLGMNREEGKRGYILMDDEESEAGKYIIGTQGQGKSAFMTTLIEQDMKKGYSVIVVDAHGDLIDDVLLRVPKERLNDVYLLDIEDTKFPFGLNLLAGGDFDDVELARRVNRVLHTFERLFPDTHGMLLEKYLGNIAPVFFANPGYAISDILDFLGKDDFREALLKNCHNPFVNQFWEEDFGEMTASKKKSETESLRTRLNRFVRSSITGGIIAQSDTTIDFKKAIENKEIILVRLPMKTLPKTVLRGGTDGWHRQGLALE